MKEWGLPVHCILVSVVNKDWASRPRTWRQNTFKDRFRLRGAREHKTKKSNSTVAQVHAINTLLNSVKGSAIKLTVDGALTAFMS